MKLISSTSNSVVIFSALTIFVSCSHSERKANYDQYEEKNKTFSVNEPAPASMSSSANNGISSGAAKYGDSINGYIPSYAATNTGDSNRKFIRTADLKFKVKSVIKSTLAMEEIIKHFGGFVTTSNLSSRIDRTESTNISADSSLETTYYTVYNNMVLRIPANKLDTTLKTIAFQIDYLDYRNIKADDVEFDLLTNKLAQIRLERQQRRLSKEIDEQGKKLKETTSAEELLADKEDAEDNTKIQNLMLKDKIDFSFINIEIYQRQNLKRELIANEQNIKAYKPGFGSELLEGLNLGWVIFKAIVVFLIDIWFLYVFAIVAYIGYRIFSKKIKQ